MKNNFELEFEGRLFCYLISCLSVSFVPFFLLESHRTQSLFLFYICTHFLDDLTNLVSLNTTCTQMTFKFTAFTRRLLTPDSSNSDYPRDMSKLGCPSWTPHLTLRSLHVLPHLRWQLYPSSCSGQKPWWHLWLHFLIYLAPSLLANPVNSPF